ncbi:MAG: hypothetical protein KIS85_04440 [Anaerolineales bacterium]|nr:hypothetical protein [Anaerolineales bacterium]
MSQDDPIQEKQAMFADEADQGGGSRIPGWLRGLLFFLLFVAAAGLLVWFMVIAPQNARIAQLTTDLDAANQQIATLQAAQPLQSVYSLLADANTARFELMRNRPESASAALLSSERTLAALTELVGDRYGDTLADVQARLELVKTDIAADDSLAALSDLEVLVNILTQLQRTIAGQ